MGRINYVFVDFENVHEVDLDLIGDKLAVVILILGEKHKNLPVGMVKGIHRYAAQVRLIEAGRSGRNALDFVLAYHVGVEANKDPTGYFHIVSRDTGFDALVLHLKKSNIFARRDESFAKAFGLPTANLLGPQDRVNVVTERLTKNKKSRPKRKKTLLSQINAYFGKLLTENELEEILKTLVDSKTIELNSLGHVSYKI